MNMREFSNAMNKLDLKYIEETLYYKRKTPPSRAMKWCAVAACLCFILVAYAAGIFSSQGIALSAYAYETGQELSSVRSEFITGSIDDKGNLIGHPLMFYLDGENIDTVCFSCKNGELNFVDLNEQRDEFGFAQNFTVYYGNNRDDYRSLLIDWVPSHLIKKLSDINIAISDLEKPFSEDVIVMEIKFSNGRTLTKAIFISLEADGTFCATLGDYKISPSDDFVNRVDSEPVPRENLYKNGELTITFFDKSGKEVFPNANWYIAKNIDYIVVRWMGRTPNAVQMVFTPSGSEMATELYFLSTEAISAENKIIISANSLHHNNLMGHLQIIIRFGSTSIKSELYNIIYDPNV